MPAATTMYKSPYSPYLREARERRETTRIRTPVPVKVRTVGLRQRPALTSVIDNLSAGGFYARMMREFEPGERVFALIKFVVGPGEGKKIVRLAVRGRVLRVDKLPGGVYGVAVKICQHRFI